MAEIIDQVQTQSFDAFISYRRSDGTRAAHRLRKRLLAFRLPKTLRTGRQRKLSIFMDTAYERGAADFYDATIKPALLSARWLIIIATPDAVRRDSGDDWIAREIADFASGPNRENIIVVRAKGEFLDRLPADVNERYPNVQIVDLRDDSFLARLSPQVSARFADEMLKVAGPLFSISLDDMPRLRREEEKRQMTRIGAVAGALTTTVVATVAVSLYTLQSQVQANRLLAETARVTDRNIIGILGSYAEEEPLDSPQRLQLFNNCELAARLRSLGGESTSQSALQACAIEEGAALVQAAASRPEERAEALKQIETAIAVAHGLKAKAGDEEASWQMVVRSGYSTLALLEQGTAAEQRRIALADFEVADALDDERRAREDSKMSPDDRAFLLRDAAEGLNRAAALFDVTASGLVKTDSKLAIGVYHKASEARAQALAALVRQEGFGTAVHELWLDTARGLAGHALGEEKLLSASDPAEAQRRLSWALAQISPASPPQGIDRKKHDFLLGWLRYAQLRRAGHDTDEDRRRIGLRETLTQVRGVANDDQSDWQEAGQGAAQAILEAFFDSTDAWRRRIEALAAAGRHGEAATQLTRLIDEHLSLEPLLIEPDSWHVLYAVIACRDLARHLDNAGDADGAEAARIRAQGLYRPFMSGEGLDTINSGQARDVEGAWDDIYKGHYRRTDALQEQARATKDNLQAVALFSRLIAEDEAWDKGMASSTEWDDVYRAGVWHDLAARQQSLGNAEDAMKSLARACELMAPYKGNFSLPSDLLQVAQQLQGALKTCRGS